MAIKRCPYCRAIIDEKDQYCNNCGTQLLFPDDEAVEEEIPGEKIIEESDEEKDYEIPEPGDEGESHDTAVDDEADEEDEDDEEEVIILDKAEDQDKEDDEDSEETGEEDIQLKLSQEDKEEERAEEKTESVSMESGANAEGAMKDQRQESEEKSGNIIEPNKPEKEEAPEDQKSLRQAYPMTFDTAELDKIGKTAELGKDQVDKFLDILKQKEDDNKALRVKAREVEEKLPPWANVKREYSDEGPAAGEEPLSDQDAEIREEREPEEEEMGKLPGFSTTDSGMGFPEKVTQSVLPFEKVIPREEIPFGEKVVPPPRREMPADDAAKEEVEAHERPPLRLSAFLKAKAFDLLFVAVFWLVSLWIAARSMDVTLFQMFGAAPAALFLFYGILIFFYFFLFYFFLGETLGDRLFRDADEI